MNTALKTLIITASKMDTTIKADYLRTHGIEVFVNGSREYASIITGIDYGRYELQVPVAQYADATKLLEQVEGQPLTQNSKVESHPPIHHLKKSIISAVIALFILPIVFNYFSIKALIKYVKLSPPSVGKALGVAVSLALNLLLVGFLLYSLDFLQKLRSNVNFFPEVFNF